MKSLFIVSAAVGIFSGTSISAKAQLNVSRLDGNAPVQRNISFKFIDNIELKRDVAVIKQTAPQPVVTAVPKAIPAPAKKAAREFASTIEQCSPVQFKYAQLMDMEVESLANSSLYNFIDEWWGTHYRYGGTTKRGIDCSAYTGELLRQVFGFNPPRTARAQYAVCQKIRKDELQEGDLVFFNTTGGVSHVGVYLGNNYFTHSSTSHGVTISNLNDSYYSRKFISGGRMSSNTNETLEEVSVPTE